MLPDLPTVCCKTLLISGGYFEGGICCQRLGAVKYKKTKGFLELSPRRMCEGGGKRLELQMSTRGYRWS